MRVVRQAAWQGQHGTCSSCPSHLLTCRLSCAHPSPALEPTPKSTRSHSAPQFQLTQVKKSNPATSTPIPVKPQQLAHSAPHPRTPPTHNHSAPSRPTHPGKGSHAPIQAADVAAVVQHHARKPHICNLHLGGIKCIMNEYGSMLLNARNPHICNPLKVGTDIFVYLERELIQGRAAGQGTQLVAW